MPRAILVMILAAALAPGVLVRDSAATDGARAGVRFTRLAHPARPGPRGAPVLVGAWRLTSAAREFGGYSALAALPGGRLAAFSDRGAYLVFAAPGAGAGAAVRLGAFGKRRGTASKRDRDCEAVTLDPASGTLWAAYEQSHAIVRFAPGLVERARVRPAAMRRWPANRGAEAMVRLADGRFVVLGETRDRAGRHLGLLFAGDPTAGSRPVRFAYRPPPGYRPTDIAALPDGRVLILNRRLHFPLRFSAKLAVADPTAIRPGATWRGRTIAALAAPLPADNFEGLAVAPGRGGKLAIWLISDDNQAQHVQRTLLLKLDWAPGQAAPAG